MMQEITVLDYWRMRDNDDLPENYEILWYDDNEIPVMHKVTDLKRSSKETETSVEMISLLDFEEGNVVEFKDNETILFAECYGVEF